MEIIALPNKNDGLEKVVKTEKVDIFFHNKWTFLIISGCFNHVFVMDSLGMVETCTLNICKGHSEELCSSTLTTVSQ